MADPPGRLNSPGAFRLQCCDHHSRFWLLSPDHGARFTDTIEIHLVELSKFELASAETATPLDRWVYFMLNAAQTDTESIPEILDRPEFHKAFGELEMLEKGREEWRQLGELIGQIRFCEERLGRSATPREKLLPQHLDELQRIAAELLDEVRGGG